jgi:hypothetical protein
MVEVHSEIIRAVLCDCGEDWGNLSGRSPYFVTQARLSAEVNVPQ